MTTPYDDLAAKARAAEVATPGDGAITNYLSAVPPSVVLALLADLSAARARVEKMERVVSAAFNCAPSLPPCDDWACIECKPYSDMLVEGFRCRTHRLKAALDALEAP
jgi:hypothetical protein